EREYIENASKSTEVGKLALSENLDQRKRAQTAKAPTLVTELYIEAETQFKKATKKVESGDVKNGLKEAQKAMPLFSTAELEAVRKDILGKADQLIEKSLADDAGKYALATLDKAKTARKKADMILTKDRYERDESLKEADRAEYEARHASNIALSVRAINKNDQAWEKLMLIYEIQMNRIGKEIGLQYLPFDNGPLAAADTLIAYINNLQSKNQTLSSKTENIQSEMKDFSGTVVSNLQNSLSKFNAETDSNDPVTLTQELDKQIESMIADKKDLQESLNTKTGQLRDLRAQHGEVEDQLAARVKREQKFKKAKQILNPSEGEVLFNSSNDIVLRLTGISFDVNKSNIKDNHMPLLGKVEEVIKMFPDALIRIEGHTDDRGEPSRNITLSEKRALAVMTYLRQSLLIPASRISSVGYGADHPVASNQSSEGRAKNRRIDVIIMQ
ncbi:MAG: hypothetical protein DWP97_09940, partial [Calditrichaeota bacterium]